MSKRFPFLRSQMGEDYVEMGVPLTVDWSLIAPHDSQAKRNHGGQNLEKLASRGGLSPREMLAVMTDRCYMDVDRLSRQEVWSELQPMVTE